MIGVWATLWLYKSLIVGTPELKNLDPSVSVTKWFMEIISESGLNSFININF